MKINRSNNKTWERKFGILFISKETGKKNKGIVYANPEDIKDFIRNLLLQQKLEGEYENGKAEEQKRVYDRKRN